MLIGRREVPKDEWKSVLGAQILFAPIDRAMINRARHACRKAVVAGDVATPPADDAAEDADDQGLLALMQMGEAFSHTLILEGTRDWRDVFSERQDESGANLLDANGDAIYDPLPFTRENLIATLSDPMVFTAFDAAYVVPFAERERSKNVSAALPNGTGEAATQASDTANSRVEPAKTRDAKRARTAKPRSRTTAKR